MKTFLSLFLFFLTTFSLPLHAESMLDLADPNQLPKLDFQPAGYPEEGKLLTPEAFQNPPQGFGEVPFWWWTGDPLDRERLAWQIRELHEKGVTGMQVNYAHKDSAGWPTFPNSPEIFSPEWWDFWAFAAQECGKYGMGIGLSTYTLDWTSSKNLFNEIVYNDPEFHTRTLHGREITDGNRTPSENSLGFFECSYGGKTHVWEFFWKSHPGTLNPVDPRSGQRVIEKFFQPFVEHNPTRDARGLNWFFNDELRLGVPGQRWWTDDFAQKFREMKGYDLYEKLPALFTDVGPETRKIRFDYADVQLQLTEERYFKPIYLWHYSRGLIYGCDNNGRGTVPTEYGDYFRAVRWYSAPGHDTPGGHADFIKGKVSSSIANLYRRPRVWLEGYHSLGWSASPETLMTATNENFAYGCTLLNLHGLYYTTHGSMWEWAPPCYHFRMPYWKQMGVFLKNFERLSWVLSQGVWQSEIAIMYPTSPGMMGLNDAQKRATDAAFESARRIYATGRDVTFMDDQSLLRAEIRDGKLRVAGMEFRVYVLPETEGIREEVLAKLHEFEKAGGIVASVNGKEFRPLNPEEFPRDVKLRAYSPMKFIHRKIESREGETQNVYFMTGVPKNQLISFRCAGRPELWNAMTGEIQPLEVLGRAEGFTTLAFPVTEKEAALIVFRPDPDFQADLALQEPKNADSEPFSVRKLDGAWRFRLTPTMNNQWGDFRLPVTPDNQLIGAEARRFRYKEVLASDLPAQRETLVSPTLDDSSWIFPLYGVGTRFFMTRGNEQPVPYRFSWRNGIELNPGHQGWHGSKKSISDHFIGLGRTKEGLNETLFVEEDPPRAYRLVTKVHHAGPVRIQKGGNLPTRVLLDGKELPPETETLTLTGAVQTLELEYAHAGRGFWLFEAGNPPKREAQPEEADVYPREPGEFPLSMTWYRVATVPFVPFAREDGKPTGRVGVYRFRAPAGLKRMVLTLDEKAEGVPEIYVDGKITATKPEETPGVEPRTRRLVVTLPTAVQAPAQVTILAPLADSLEGGAYFAEPIRLETEEGEILRLGDWSRDGTVLAHYSGGAVYTKKFTLTEAEAAAKSAILDLHAVCATAEIRLNGETVRTLVASPWETDLAGRLKPGENTLEIEVLNTLSNHYQTIPNRYRGTPTSGLIGPVEIRFRGGR